MASMKLVIIPAWKVKLNPEHYNLSIDKTTYFPRPLEEPTYFSKFSHLITKSQKISTCWPQKLTLSRAQCRLLLEASKSIEILPGSKIGDYFYRTEIKTKVPIEFRSMELPRRLGLFMRLDNCSTQDSAWDNDPIDSAEDVACRIMSSRRALSELEEALNAESNASETEGLQEDPIREQWAEDDVNIKSPKSGTNAYQAKRPQSEDDNSKNGINLYFTPYNDRLSTYFEYRVFCAPPDGGITTISQHKWRKPSVLQARYTTTGVKKITQKVFEEANRIHAEIMDAVRAGALDKLLLDQGFSFDICYDEDYDKCVLVEANPFGARGGHGACLFHWTRDVDVLYGMTQLEVEFRISMEDSCGLPILQSFHPKRGVDYARYVQSVYSSINTYRSKLILGSKDINS